MSAQKRSLETSDPDYADAREQRVKRQRLVEQDAKESVSKKIQNIVQNEFQREISNKETELQNIDKKLNDALLQMDRLRACIVAAYYGQRHQSGSSNSQAASLNAPPPSIHPALKKHLGKAPKGQAARKTDGYTQASSLTSASHERLRQTQEGEERQEAAAEQTTDPERSLPFVSSDTTSSERRSRFKIKKKIIVGNVSKYIPVDNRESNDMSSHKWMVYVRGPKTDPDISGYVRKVWFFLHHSYKPNDLVEVNSPPFHLTRRGWGEFPVRVQLHFVDSRNKKLDIIHHLKLDKTFTGLQTLGAETVLDIELHPESSSLLTGPPTSRLSTSIAQSSCPGPEHPTDSSTNGLPVKPHESKTVESHRQHQQSESFHEVLDSLKKEIVQTNGEEHETKTVGSEEYHMTIAHEQTAATVKKIKEEPEQEVDVCVEDDQNRSMFRPGVKLEITPMNFSYTNAIVKSDMTHIKEELNDRSDPVLQCSSSSCVATPSNSDTETASEGPHSKSCKSSHASSPQYVRQNTSTTSQASSRSAEDGNGPRPVKLTIIKDPFLLTSKSAQISGSSTFGVITTAASATSCTTCISITRATTTITTMTGVSQIVSVSSPSSVSLLPTIITKTATNSPPAVPLHPLQHHPPQPPGGALSKLVVIKPNPNLPIKVVNKLTVPPRTSSVPRATLSSVVQVNSTSTGGVVHRPTQNLTAYQPVVIASPPTALPQLVKPKPKSSRQVSLLTGLVVNNKSTSPSTLSPSTSLLGHSSVSSQQLSTAATNVHLQGNSRQLHPNHTSQVVVLNKASPRAHNPTVVSPITQTTTQGGRTVIKVLNKTPLSLTTPQTNNAPIRMLTLPTTMNVNINPAPVDVQTLQAQSPNTLLPTNLVSAALSSIRVKPTTDISTSAPQIMLSFPNGTATPLLPQDLESSHFPKMSAVGITKHGKGYRSALNTLTGVKKTATQEERLKGQYEVLRAFKENPELYQKKTKKIVLASSDTLEGEEDIIPKLELEDFPSLRSLLKVAVLLHPLIQHDVNKITHPYCARTMQEWNSWPIGKQRAAEWHRASSTLSYLRSCLKGQSDFKGEQLMSTRQLVDWCRLRAFSPVLPVKSKRPQKLEKSSELTTLLEDKMESCYNTVRLCQVQSLTLLDGVHSLLPHSNSGGSVESKEKLSVLDEELTLPTTEKQNCVEDVKKETEEDEEWLPPSQGAMFVYDQLRKRGVHLTPQRLDSGVMACLPAEVLYKLMVEFCADVLRETLSVCENHSSTMEVTSRDVLHGLTSLPEASFCCNKFLGKQAEHDMEVAVPR